MSPRTICTSFFWGNDIFLNFPHFSHFSGKTSSILVRTFSNFQQQKRRPKIVRSHNGEYAIFAFSSFELVGKYAFFKFSVAYMSAETRRNVRCAFFFSFFSISHLTIRRARHSHTIYYHISGDSTGPYKYI